MNLISLMS